MRRATGCVGPVPDGVQRCNDRWGQGGLWTIHDFGNVPLQTMKEWLADGQLLKWHWLVCLVCWSLYRLNRRGEWRRLLGGLKRRNLTIVQESTLLHWTQDRSYQVQSSRCWCSKSFGNIHAFRRYFLPSQPKLAVLPQACQELQWNRHIRNFDRTKNSRWSRKPRQYLVGWWWQDRS